MTTKLSSELIIKELGRIAYFVRMHDGAIDLLDDNEKAIISILDDVEGVFEKIKNFVEKVKIQKI